MTLLQIQCFLTVADKMSITAASKELFVSQPAVSLQISRLENELGLKLFQRDNAKLTITPAGQKIYSIFSYFTQNLSKTVDELKLEDTSMEHVISIGCGDGWELSFLEKNIREKLRDSYPDIDISVTFYDHAALMEAYENRQIDIMIDFEDFMPYYSSGAKIHKIKSTSCAFFYSKAHPLSLINNPTLSDFQNYPIFISCPESHRASMISELLNLCMRSNFVPKIEYLQTLSSVFAATITGNGVFFGDYSLYITKTGLFNSFHLPLEKNICLCTHKNSVEACNIVTSLILSHIEQTGNEYL